MRDSELVAFLQWALPRMGMSWKGFRKVRGQVRKRLSRRLRTLGLDDLDGYRAHLESNPSEWAALDAFCRITISRFYRDRAVFDTLRDAVLPKLARAAADRDDRVVRAWSAGCASGEEPYTLSLAWALDASTAVAGVELSIVATDTDARLLDRARRACYAPGTLKELPPEWLDDAFTPADGTLCLRPEFRRRVRLRQQDIRAEMPTGEFDLVLCRNLVFTYYEVGRQRALLERIVQTMRPEGFLVLGAHETLPEDGPSLKQPYGTLPIYGLA